MVFQDDELRSKIDRVKQIKFVSPYARYLAILPVAEKQRLVEQARLDEENKKKKLCPDKVVSEDQKFVSTFRTLSLLNCLLITSLLQTIKTEPTPSNSTGQPSNEADHMPLKDFGKRRREMAEAASPPTKKPRFDINVRDTPSTATTSSIASESAVEQTSTNGTPITSKKQQRKQKKSQVMSNKKSAQSSNKPVAFDYSQVDFSKFQGGSKKQVNTNATTSKFHGKVSFKRRIYSFTSGYNRISFFL